MRWWSIQNLVPSAILLFASATGVAQAQHFGASSTMNPSVQPGQSVFGGQTADEIGSIGAPNYAQNYGASVGVNAIAADGASGSPTVFANGGCDVCENCCDACWPQTYIQLESIFLWRSSKDYDLDAGIGPQLVVGIRVDPEHAWEGRYFSALNMSATWSPNGGYFGSTYTSDLHNAEINYLRTWNSFSLLAGFRFLRLAEDYQYRHSYNGAAISLAENNLYGGQLGLRWRRNYRGLDWELTGRAGVFGNDTNNSYSYGYYPNSFVEYETAVSFVGDLNLSAVYRLSEHWGLRAGYNTLWISQVALAPYGSATDNSVFLHGVNAGLEARW